MFDSYFMLIFSEAIVEQLETPYKPQIRSAFDACWGFLENKDRGGEELYALLDDGTMMVVFSFICNWMKMKRISHLGIISVTR